MLKSAANNIGKTTMWLKNPFFLIAISLISLSVFYFAQRSIPTPAPYLPVVEVSVVKPTSIKKTIKLIGTLRTKHSTLLTAKMPGVLEQKHLSGQNIKKGELIALIVNPEIEKNYQLSRDAEAISQAQYNRFLQLKEKGFVSIRELEDKKQKWIDTQKELARTKIEIDNLRFYAPFDGLIGAFKIREGTHVKAGDAIVTIYDPQDILIDLDVPCHYLKKIKEHQPVFIKHKKYHLAHLQRMMDDESHMCPADIDIHCTHCVIGDNVNAELLIEKKKNIIVLPTQSLFLKDGKFSVYKVVNNRIELVRVKSGIQQQDSIEISSGINPGDQVIIKNPARLYPGMEVSIYQPEQKTQG